MAASLGVAGEAGSGSWDVPPTPTPCDEHTADCYRTRVNCNGPVPTLHSDRPRSHRPREAGADTTFGLAGLESTAFLPGFVADTTSIARQAKAQRGLHRGLCLPAPLHLSTGFRTVCYRIQRHVLPSITGFSTGCGLLQLIMGGQVVRLTSVSTMAAFAHFQAALQRQNGHLQQLAVAS